MRIQIELKREAIPQVALNKLFKHTALQTTFGYNAVALVDGVPRTLSLLELVRHYLDFQREVVTRRSKYELRKARGARARPRGLPDRARQPRRGDRADPRRPTTPTRRATGLMEQLRALRDPGAGDPRPAARARSPGSSASEIEDEYADLQERIAELRAILGDEARIDALIREELLELKEIYGTQRRPAHGDRRRRGPTSSSRT